MISWFTGKIAVGGLIASAFLVAFLGIKCIFLTHQLAEAQNEALSTRLSFETFKREQTVLLADRIKQNALDAESIQALAKNNLESYEKGKADATRNFAAIAKRNAGLRIKAPDNPSPDSSGVPKDAGTSAAIDTTCNDKLRDARERFNDLVGGVEKVSGALSICQEQAIRLQQMIEFEKSEREKINR